MAERQQQQQVASDGDAAEWKQVAELRAVTQAQDPSCKVRPLSLFHDSIHPLLVSRQSYGYHSIAYVLALPESEWDPRRTHSIIN